MTKCTQPDLTERLQKLQDAFIRGEVAGESDAEIADAVLQLILGWERLRHRVNAGTPAAKTIDRNTFTKMQSWDSNDPTMSTIEKVFKRIASGRGGDGITLLKDAIIQRAEQFKKQQKQKAALPRPRSKAPLTVLVEKIVRSDPRIESHELFKKLRESLNSMKKPSYVYRDGVFHSNGKYPDVKQSNLRQYLQRAKKNSR